MNWRTPVKCLPAPNSWRIRKGGKGERSFDRLEQATLWVRPLRQGQQRSMFVRLSDCSDEQVFSGSVLWILHAPFYVFRPERLQ